LFPDSKAPAYVPEQAEATEAKAAPVQPRPLGEILDDVVGFLRRWVVFQFSEQAIVCGLWVLHTWLFRAFDYTPYLWVYAADMRSGKSRLLEVLNLLTPNPCLTESGSSAALVRSINEDEPPTMLLDEIDVLYDNRNKGDAEANNTKRFLNAGYKRGAKFLRCVGQGANLKPAELPAFCPKGLAGIGQDLPATVQDRSLPIELVRQTREERAERLRDREARKATAGLVSELKELAQQEKVINALQEARPALPEKLGDRQQDITEPLVAIADYIGGHWPESARTALVKLYGQEEEASLGVKLLIAIKRAFDKTDKDKLTTRELLDELVKIEDGPWAAMFEDALKHDRLQIAASKLARKLRKYKTSEGRKLESRSIKIDSDTVLRGYHKEDFLAAWARWLPGPGQAATSATAATYEGKTVAAANPVARYQDSSRYQKYEGSSSSSGSSTYPEGEQKRDFGAMSDAELEAWWNASKFVYPFNEPEWVQLFPDETQPHWQAAFKQASAKLCEVCGEKALFDDPCLPDTHYWFNINTHAVNCQSCRETYWRADGYEIDGPGLPFCWDHEHTREQRIAERTRNQLQKAAEYRAQEAGLKDWRPIYQALLAQEPEPVRQMIQKLSDWEERELERRHGMTPGEFLAEATALFNATLAKD
jgi:hypothetical protein